MPVFNVTVDDTSPFIVYSGGLWSDSSDADPDKADYNNSTFHATKQYNATATIVFNGFAIYVFGAKRGTHDQYLAILDGSSTVGNGYYDGDIFQQALFTAENLDRSEHSFTLKNHYTTSQPSYVDLDYVVFTSGDGNPQTQSVDTVWDDSDPAIQYSSGWEAYNDDSDDNYYNSTVHGTSIPNASAVVQFRGNSVALYGDTDTDHGLFNVSLDGKAPLTLNGTAPTPRYGMLLYYAGGLSDDPHILTVTNVGSNGNWLDLDKIVVSSWNGTRPDPANVSSASSGAPQTTAISTTAISTTTTVRSQPSIPATSDASIRGHRSITGSVVGGVLGGVALLLIISLGVLYAVRRHRSHLQHHVASFATPSKPPDAECRGAARSTETAHAREVSAAPVPVVPPRGSRLYLHDSKVPADHAIPRLRRPVNEYQQDYPNAVREAWFAGPI